jgi:hypothetical protein
MTVFELLCIERLTRLPHSACRRQRRLLGESEVEAGEEYSGFFLCDPPPAQLLHGSSDLRKRTTNCRN